MLMSNAYDYINVLGRTADASFRRNEILVNNIANKDVPNYKRKDIQFETYLAEALSSGDSLDAMVSTIEYDTLSPTVYTDRGHLDYRMDGNNVDIDVENVELAKNQLKYYTLTDMINQEFQRLKTAISIN